MKKTKKQKTPTEPHPVVAGFLNILKTEFEPRKVRRKKLVPRANKEQKP